MEPAGWRGCRFESLTQLVKQVLGRSEELGSRVENKDSNPPADVQTVRRRPVWLRHATVAAAPRPDGMNKHQLVFPFHKQSGNVSVQMMPRAEDGNFQRRFIDLRRRASWTPLNSQERQRRRSLLSTEKVHLNLVRKQTFILERL